MTAPVEHLFRGGERVSPEEVRPEMLATLRRLAVADPKTGASIVDVSRCDACRIYSLVIRPADASPMPFAIAGGGDSQ